MNQVDIKKKGEKEDTELTDKLEDINRVAKVVKGKEDLDCCFSSC